MSKAVVAMPARRGRRRKREALTKQLRAGRGVGSAGPISTAGVGDDIEKAAKDAKQFYRRKRRGEIKPNPNHSGVPRRKRRWRA